MIDLRTCTSPYGGLIEPLPSPTDRRKRLASLTDAGHDTRTQLANCVGERRPTFSELSLDDLTTFRDLLRRVTSTRPTALG
jgi:DNA-binding MarR family transcriptional regulator